MFMVLSSWPKVIARVHPVHLMNVDWAPGGRQPPDQASRLGLWVRRKLAAIIHIHHRHCFFVIITQPVGWYSFYRPTKSGRLSRPKYCSKGAQPVLKTVYRSSCCDKHNCQRRDSNRDPHTAVRRANRSATETCHSAIETWWCSTSGWWHYKPFAELLNYLSQYGLISKYQDGFLYKHDTCSNMLESGHDWAVALNSRYSTSFSAFPMAYEHTWTWFGSNPGTIHCFAHLKVLQLQ